MIIENLYSLKSFKDMGKEVENVMKGTRFSDAYNGAVLNRNLTHVDPQVFEKKYPELTFFNLGIGADNTGGYAKRIQSLRTLEHGEFALAGDKTSNKGKISISAEDSDILVYQKEAFAEWTKTDAETCALQNINLTSRLISTMDKQYKREIDEAGFVGVEGNKGLLNNTVFATTASADTADNLTSEALYQEIADLITAQHTGVSNTAEYKANVVVLPVRVYNILSRKMLNTAGSAQTVLSALMANFADITFYPSFRADNVDGGGSVTCAVNASSETMKMRIPTQLEIGEVIKLGSFSWKVDAQYRIAGLDILEPTAGALLTGL